MPRAKTKRPPAAQLREVRVVVYRWDGEPGQAPVRPACPECGGPTVLGPSEISVPWFRAAFVGDVRLALKQVFPGCPTCQLVLVPETDWASLTDAGATFRPGLAEPGA